MASPEIDEAAAVKAATDYVYIVEKYYLRLMTPNMEENYNLARAALSWKARAEAAEAERDRLREKNTELNRRATRAEGQVIQAKSKTVAGIYRHERDEARAEVASLRRQLAQSVKAR